MSRFETFSKRQKRRESLGVPEVYQYTQLPKEFRIQVIHIWHSAIGNEYGFRAGTTVINPYWHEIYNTLIRELGVFLLISGVSEEELSYQDGCIQYLLSSEVESALDIIDLSFHVLYEKMISLDSGFKSRYKITQDVSEAIDEINQRFKEHSIGYAFERGELIRIDSQYIHAEVVKPALSLLQELGFQGAEDEFFQAHKYYRDGKNKEAVVNALKAFESTMKAICIDRGWSFESSATAKTLIDILFKQKLLPSMLESSFSGLRAVLEGLPTIRNKTSGHGQGTNVVDIPAYLASYPLHLAASNIVFLAEAHKAYTILNNFGEHII